MIIASLAGLPAFLLYFVVSAAVIVLFLFVYTRITAHHEFELIARNEPAAAFALGLSTLGFALPVASAIAHAANIIDCLIWSLIAFVVQILVYFALRLAMPDLSQRIARGETAAGIWLGFVSLTAGLISAASMTS